MASKARGLADLGNVYSDGALSNRNLIINGAMQVAQRGTSGGATAGYVYTLDRWLANGNITSWAQTGSQKSVLQVVTQAGTGIAQRVESNGANLLSGKVYTLSFLVNPSVADVEVGITFRNGNSFLSDVVPITDVSSQVVVGSYSTVTHTFTLPASADISTYLSHNMQVYIGSSVVNTLNLMEVQLELGDTATPFEHRSYGDELQRCMRYYEQINAETDYSFIGVGVGVSATVVSTEVKYSKKRTAPSISGTGNFVCYDGIDRPAISVIFAHIASTRCTGNFTCGDIVAGRAYKTQFHFSGDRNIKIDAEL